MQCSPPFLVAGPPNSLQFYPCTTPPPFQNYTTPSPSQNYTSLSPPLQNYTTPSPPLPSFPQTYQTCNFQSYNGPVSNVVGEGDVTYVVLPDGTLQLFFFPATGPRCGRCLQNNASPGWNNNATSNGPWFIRSVNTHGNRSQQHRLPPCGNYNDYSQNNSLQPYPEIQTNRGVKFHNDRCTSSEDLGYFCRSKLQRHDTYFPSKCSTSVQVSRDPAHVAQSQVCDAPCKCPHNCAGKSPVFEGFFGRYDSDMSVSETRRGEKRGKSQYSDSPCTSCERNSKRRKYIVSSDSNSSSLSSDQWQWERKRQQKDYENQRRERKRELKELDKIMKEREKEKKKQDKEFEKFLKESEKRNKESEKGEEQRRQKELKEKEKRERELEKKNQQRKNRRKNDPRPDSGSTNSSKCVLCKLSTAVSSLASFATSSSSTNPCYVECPKYYEKECKKLFDKELKRREAVRIKSEQSLEKMRKTEQKMSEQELKKRESECKKIEAAIQKKIKSNNKKMEQEQKRKAGEKHKKKQGKYGENRIGNSSNTNQIKQPDCPCYLSRSTLVKKQPNVYIKDSLECSCAASLMSEDKSLKSNKERPIKDSIECSCAASLMSEDKSLKSNKERPIKDPLECSCAASLMSEDKSLKSNKERPIKDPLECSCTPSLMSEDKSLKSNKERPLQVVDISEHPCQGCDNYCNKARASGKTSMAHMEQADKSNADQVLKSILLCSTDLNPPEDSHKDCGVLCEGPIKANKEVATHSDQASSGMFAAIINKFGIGIQCSKCAPPAPPPPPPGTAAPDAEVGGSQIPLEFVTCANDGNVTICAKTNPTCIPL